ncbi:MAG: NADH-quinone oxidoreductase subunit L, partial [Rhodospirillaceae bacterium]|nr:NADH-quinone oxidoreductase subunit L [Rhodospirillaceae bacterium]
MYIAAVFLPLIGSLIAGMIAFAALGAVRAEDAERKKRLDLASQLITCGAMLLAAVAAILVFIAVVVNGQNGTVELFTWVDSGSLEFSWALRGDTLAVLMVTMVTVVSSMIHI